MRIITVSREFSSGGRELGKRLSDELGIAYYDREILSKIAEKSQMDEEYVEKTLDRGFSVGFPYTVRRSFYSPAVFKSGTPGLLAKQKEVILSIAEKGEDFIIVGRSADFVLAEFSPFKIFVYADMAEKIKRCRLRAPEEEKLSDRELERKIRQIDKARAVTHDLISDCAWGDMHTYHLCINTTAVEIKSIVPQTAAYILEWFR